MGIKISEIAQRLTDIVNETNVEVSEKIGDTSVTKKFDLKKLQDQIDGKASAAILQDAIAQIDTLTNQVEDKVDGPETSVIGNLPIFGSEDGKTIIDSGTSIADIVSQIGGGSGDVTGPWGAGDGNIAVFDGSSGKAIRDSYINQQNIVQGSGNSVYGHIPVFGNDLGNYIYDSGYSVDDLLGGAGGGVVGQTPVESMVTITVGPAGSGADFFTLKSAIDHAIKNYRPAKAVGGPFVKISILSNFITYESIVIDGIDLSWILIDFGDIGAKINTPQVFLQITNNAKSPILNGWLETDLSPSPIFAEVTNGGVLLGLDFHTYSSNPGDIAMIKVYDGGIAFFEKLDTRVFNKVDIKNGFVYARYADHVDLYVEEGMFVCEKFGNHFTCAGIFSNKGNIILGDATLSAQNTIKIMGGTLTIGNCVAETSGVCIEANNNAIVNIKQTLEIGNNSDTVIKADNGSVVNIGSTTYDGANYTYGRLWLKGAINNVIDCKRNSTVNINGRLQIDNGVNGFLVSCTDQSKVNIQNIVPEGLGADAAIGNNIGTSGAIICSERSVVNIPSVDLSGTSGIGIDCNNYSVVNARNIRLSGYTTAIKSANGSTVNIPGVVIIDKEGCVLETAITCLNGSSVRAPGAVIRDATINAILCSDSSIVHAPGATIQDITGQLALCENGSALNIKNTVATSNVTSGIVSKTGSNVYANGANISTANTVDLSVEQGGFIFAHGAIADLSKAVNTMGADGIIWGDEPAP